ncbi:MAG TPA: hypothetical protein VFU89_06510 [Rhabdochlamydiaceae bacterium]|nr:hypothetical protein [Rhabdochlamydiaceae bacterium]
MAISKAFHTGNSNAHQTFSITPFDEIKSIAIIIIFVAIPAICIGELISTVATLAYRWIAPAKPIPPLLEKINDFFAKISFVHR